MSTTSTTSSSTNTSTLTKPSYNDPDKLIVHPNKGYIATGLSLRGE